jgi:hypothetical protein
VEEKQQAQGDEHQSAADPDHDVVVSKPPERAHRLRESDSGEQEGEAEARRVRREQDGSPKHRAGIAGQDEDRRQDRSDARCGANRESRSEQRARPPLAGPDEETRGQDPLRPGQQPDEREAEDDENEAGELGLPVSVEDAADRRRARAEQDEDDGEAADERQAGERDPAGGSRAAKLVGLDRGYRRQVAGNERQDAGRDYRDEPREERQRDAL